jgi:hypothetical protein
MKLATHKDTKRGGKLLLPAFLALITLVSGGLLAAENRLSDNLTREDLDSNCGAKFLEIHMEASNIDDAGMAIMKLFWMVDPEFLKIAASEENDPPSWGLKLGEAFRIYCEQRPPVKVRTAIKQAIIFMEEGK